jgi:hypothetical protein
MVAFRFWVAIAGLSRVLSGSLNWMIGSSTTRARAAMLRDSLEGKSLYRRHQRRVSLQQ